MPSGRKKRKAAKKKINKTHQINNNLSHDPEGKTDLAPVVEETTQAVEISDKEVAVDVAVESESKLEEKIKSRDLDRSSSSSSSSSESSNEKESQVVEKTSEEKPVSSNDVDKAAESLLEEVISEAKTGLDSMQTIWETKIAPFAEPVKVMDTELEKTIQEEHVKEEISDVSDAVKVENVEKLASKVVEVLEAEVSTASKDIADKVSTISGEIFGSSTASKDIADKVSNISGEIFGSSTASKDITDKLSSISGEMFGSSTASKDIGDKVSTISGEIFGSASGLIKSAAKETNGEAVPLSDPVARSINGNESEKEPLVTSASPVVRRTSVFSCCGLLEAITGSSR